MDTKDTRVQNLLFLLTAAPMAVGGCIITSGDDTATTATTTGTPTTTETPTTTGMPTTTESPTSSGSSGGDTTAGPSDTTTVPADSTTDEPTTETGGAPEACIDYAGLVSECYDDKGGQAALEYCAEYYAYLEMYGEDCINALNDQLACLSTLSCELLMDKEPDCVPEQEAIDTICVAK